MHSRFKYLILFIGPWFMVGVCDGKPQLDDERIRADEACVKMAKEGLRLISSQQTERFLGKVSAATAECRGGEKALASRSTVWVDWPNYWATGDESSKSIGWQSITKLGRHLNPNGRGVDGALMDLEYQRMELIRFNLYDNNTYETYIKGKDGLVGPVVKVWDEMKLPPSHPEYADVTGSDGKQLCKGELIRHRNLTGICNDIYNPAMGSTNQLFARNVSFESTFPRLGANELVRNRHGDRLGLLKPDPQVISRKLFTRQQSNPEACNQGQGLANDAANANCDYKKAPFFNVLAAYWIQFMTHDWFYHLREGQNTEERMPVGCTMELVNNKEEPISEEEAKKLGCRPKDRVDVAFVADKEPAPTFQYDGKTYMKRAHRTTQNTVTAWWDASQIYGFDNISLKRVKRDPNDTAKLLMRPRGNHEGAGEKQGYLPIFESSDPINPAWKGQEAAG
ncbi:MAG: peroxidase family protein, partial [Gammaproteobacteria bacterium]